ncbi:protein NUCLEAR FUSION DEFECTIVE 4-like [Gastrolobium bilobum]|uniref:protein NUCLEAR FUSION DEFECTIVE 4-like n=1 Tax=Gastrolobium bilobum TaxID=150636 RepID=UPI002AB0B659|nr:protein NUCLEAR FUSION DEFECTIVE 4-like [Gastrolobium bilobum]
MVSFQEKLKALLSHRWMVFVCAMWDMSFVGTAYMFGSISPVIKSSMGYNQKQVAFLSVAKDLGDNVGLLAGKISEISPTWLVILVGVVQNFVGYGLVWLIVTHRFPSLPLWLLCIFIFVGQNGSTYYNTASLVSCVQNFPESRGPVVGILKGFVGLSGAIWTQIIAMINIPDQASLIFIVAVGPAMVSFTLMFIIRPIENYKLQSRASDGSGFLFIYSICLLLAAYLMGILLLENMLDLEQSTITLLALVLIILILLPIIVPILLVFFSEPKSHDEETLLEQPPVAAATKSMHADDETSAGANHVENEKPPMPDVLPLSEGPRDMVQFQTKLFHAVTSAVKKIKQKNGPHRGEDFTLTQALVKADFWIMFFSLVLGAGSGLTIINNMGQVCQSLGDDNINVYVSVISISNFLGRVGGGYFSEVIVRNFGYPRLVALAVIQAVMSLGLSYYALGLVGQVYVVAISMGFGYGAHWSIALAAASELFGLKNFGSLYNFLTMASPAGSLFLSGFVASTIYDYYAEQQAKHRMQTYRASVNFAMPYVTENNELLLCKGNICYSLTCGILAVVCLLATALSLVIVHRTKRFYAQLYGKS